MSVLQATPIRNCLRAFYAVILVAGGLLVMEPVGLAAMRIVSDGSWRITNPIPPAGWNAAVNFDDWMPPVGNMHFKPRLEIISGCGAT